MSTISSFIIVLIGLCLAIAGKIEHALLCFVLSAIWDAEHEIVKAIKELKGKAGAT